jgi:acyl-CoA synthetase (NDP forming)
VATVGPGGVFAEFLAANLKPGLEVAIFSPEVRDDPRIRGVLAAKAVTPLVTDGMRGQKARISLQDLAGLARRFLDLGEATMPDELSEFEVNPLALTAAGVVALDALGRLGGERLDSPPPRPISKIESLLKPRSLAIMGVSDRMNPGRVILDNVIRSGFPRDRIRVVKPGVDSIEGCQCFEDLSSLPEPVDLLVLAIGAAQVPEVLEEVIHDRRAESVILIPGGLDERAESRPLAEGIRASLDEARKSEDQGPVLNGGNCLGIRSWPGRYDTLFIPPYKLSPKSAGIAADEAERRPLGEAREAGVSTGGAGPSPVALISQSGALALARLERLPWLDPRYVVTLGNQSDLTAADFLEYLKDDPHLRTYAFYLEGFQPLDGRRWLRLAAEIVEGGRTVLLYRAGRTGAGGMAAASHTASIAGDYRVTRELALSAGVLVAETLREFEDLLRLSVLLEGKTIDGLRLGAVSNAGFECVSMADNLGPFTLAHLGSGASRRVQAVLEGRRLGGIVGVQNPLDLTPIADDEAFEEAVRAILDDEGVDVGVVGCVPMTPALKTLGAAHGHPEDVTAEGSLARRLVRLGQECRKAWVAVVDGGRLYDPMATVLEAGGVPTFRTSDQAMRGFGRYCQWRLMSRS